MPATRLPTVDHLGPVESCPGCEGRDFVVEERAESVVFLCLGCKTAWRYELGFVWPIEDGPSRPFDFPAQDDSPT